MEKVGDVGLRKQENRGALHDVLPTAPHSQPPLKDPGQKLLWTQSTTPWHTLANSGKSFKNLNSEIPFISTPSALDVIALKAVPSLNQYGDVG